MHGTNVTWTFTTLSITKEAGQSASVQVVLPSSWTITTPLQRGRSPLNPVAVDWATLPPF